MTQQPRPNTGRPLTPAEIRRCRAALAHRTLVAYWDVGHVLLTAMGGPRAPYRSGWLETEAKKIQKGLSADIARHYLRLARSWSRQEVVRAEAAGLGFRAVQVLAALDGQGKAELRRRLVQAFIRGRLDRSALLRRARDAKTSSPDRLQPGPRLRALLDVRRAVDGRLQQALARLEADPGLWPRAARSRARRLKARIKQARQELSEVYEAAASQLRRR